MKEKWKNDKKIRRNCVLAGIALVILLGASVYTLFIQPNLSTETYVYKEETVGEIWFLELWKAAACP
jgi:hypothetical protein